MNLFVGITFHPHFLQFKKIDSFRKRFDDRYTICPQLQMTLLPPFKVNHLSGQSYRDFGEHLEDEIEGHLLGLENFNNIEFKGMDFVVGNHSVLYLKPELPIDLFHCQENLKSVIKNYGGNFKRDNASINKRSSSELSTFLPIGRFAHLDLLNDGIDVAKTEFNVPFHLSVKDISLFEKTPGQWIKRKKLFTFSSPQDNLSLEEFGFRDYKSQDA